MWNFYNNGILYTDSIHKVYCLCVIGRYKHFIIPVLFIQRITSFTEVFSLSTDICRKCY